MRQVYLDNAATTLRKPKKVGDAMVYALTHLSSPGRGGYPSAMNAAEASFRCRLKAAALFNSEPENIIFTMNATHGLNIAIRSIVKPGMRVVVSGYEHNSVIRPLYAIGAEIVEASSELFDREGTLHAFKREISAGADAVVCTHVSNVFGFVLPVYEIGEMCRKRGVPFIMDASQSAGTSDIDIKRLGAEFIAMPGHKGLYGPQGTGILVCGKTPEPLIFGGTGSNSSSAEMPDVLPDIAEAGTHNMPGICGLEAGIDYVMQKRPDNILKYEKSLIQSAYEELSRYDRLKIWADKKGKNQGGVISFTVEGITCEETGSRLAEMGIAVRTGLHCAPCAHRTAGTFETGTVRMSVSAFSSQGDMEYFVDSMEKIIKN